MVHKKQLHALNKQNDTESLSDSYLPILQLLFPLINFPDPNFLRVPIGFMNFKSNPRLEISKNTLGVEKHFQFYKIGYIKQQTFKATDKDIQR